MQPALVEKFVHQVVTDMAATNSSVLANLGHKLGLYRAMAGMGPMTPAQLAERTGLFPRYVLEWLRNQAAGAYITYDPATRTYELPPEHAYVLANPDSPVFLPPAFDVSATLWRDEDLLADAFRSGKGIHWGEHDHRLFHAVEAFFRNGYLANLTTSWIPALDGVEAKLQAGGRVADVGCGHGASAVIMAQAYPKSRFWGFDAHEGSIETARQRAAESGVGERVRFEAAVAAEIPDEGYDLICFFDALHDFGDPLSAARRAREVLGKGGTVMLVEPFAHDDDAHNLGLIARLYTAGSTGLCTPNAVAQGGHHVLGAQAGEARLTAVLEEAGFTRVRRAAETPFNLILEARV